MLEDTQMFLLKFLNNTRERNCYDANDKESQVCWNLLPYLVFHCSPLYFFLCRSDLSETKNDRITGLSGDKCTIYILYSVMGTHSGLSRLIVHHDIIVSDTFFHVLSFVWKYYTEYYTPNMYLDSNFHLWKGGDRVENRRKTREIEKRTNGKRFMRVSQYDKCNILLSLSD